MPVITFILGFVAGLVIGSCLKGRNDRASLKTLSDVVSETEKASDSLADEISRNQQNKGKQ